MDRQINELVERANAFMARKPGILPLLGLTLIVLNLLLRIYPGPDWWIVRIDLFLHVGLVVSILGLLLVNVYRH
jgi:hypothetical protein